MKNIIKILFLLSFSIVFGQNEITLDYSQDLAYRGNLNITIFANYDKIENDFIISLLGENITPNNTVENQIGIKTNKEKHLLFIEVLKKYNTSNEIYYYNFDYDSENFFYETNTNRKVKNVSNAILALQVDYLSICADTFFIYIFDFKNSILLLKELSEIYGNKEDFEKVIKIINDNYPNAEIQGVVHSTINNKLVTKKVYITENKTKQIVKADEYGKFKINNLKKNTNYNLEISAYDYKTTKFRIKTNDSIIKKDFDLKGNCEYNKKSAKRDWNNGTPKLLLKTGGIAGNFANRSIDNEFELKYNIEYVSFGCMPPNEKCIKVYNKQIFKLLDKNYGKKWRLETRYDVDYLEKKDVEKIINRIKKGK